MRVCSRSLFDLNLLYCQDQTNKAEPNSVLKVWWKVSKQTCAGSVLEISLEHIGKLLNRLWVLKKKKTFEMH